MEVLLHGLIHRADDIVGVQFAVCVEIKGNPRRHGLQLFGIDVADDGDERAGLVRRLGRIAAHRKELGNGGLGRTDRQFRLEHDLDRLQLRIIHLKSFFAAGEEK